MPRSRPKPRREARSRPPEPAPRREPPHLLAALPALVVTAALHAPALGTWFAQDDITFLSRARGLEPTPAFFRRLSEGWAFVAQVRLFGLHPMPFHAVNLTLHLLNTLLVYAIGARLLGSRRGAGAAALLFGTSSIAFTPLHWATGIVELLSAALILLATLLHLRARERGDPAGSWVAAGLALAAAFAKETTVAWLAALAVLELRAGLAPARARALIPAALAAAAFVAAFVLTRQAQRFEASEAYARSLHPLVLFHGLMTYAAWSVSLHEPIRDLLAVLQPDAWRIGLPVAIAVVLLLVLRRKGPRRPEEAGAAWWLAFLLPVLPLVNHAYLYYLYLPWAGACWLVAAAGERALRRLPAPAAAITAVILLAGATALELRNLRVRATAMREDLPLDRTMRDAALLQASIGDLKKAALPAGTRVAFVNPFPRVHVDISGSVRSTGTEADQVHSYLPLEAAFRGGETLRLLVPQVRSLGFADSIPPGWEDARIFLFGPRGDLMDWGSGGRALAHEAEACQYAKLWARSVRAYRRARALGEDGPDATAGLIVGLSNLGEDTAADTLAREFLRRWPDEPRAARIREALAAAGR